MVIPRAFLLVRYRSDRIRALDHRIFSQHVSDCSSQRCFTVVNVADGTNVNVGFVRSNFFFEHARPSKHCYGKKLTGRNA